MPRNASHIFHSTTPQPNRLPGAADGIFPGLAAWIGSFLPDNPTKNLKKHIKKARTPASPASPGHLLRGWGGGKPPLHFVERGAS